jgi:hypothetical protein
MKRSTFLTLSALSLGSVFLSTQKALGEDLKEKAIKELKARLTGSDLQYLQQRSDQEIGGMMYAYCLKKKNFGDFEAIGLLYGMFHSDNGYPAFTRAKVAAMTASVASVILCNAYGGGSIIQKLYEEYYEMTKELK